MLKMECQRRRVNDDELNSCNNGYTISCQAREACTANEFLDLSDSHRSYLREM